MSNQKPVRHSITPPTVSRPRPLDHLSLQFVRQNVRIETLQLCYVDPTKQQQTETPTNQTM